VGCVCACMKCVSVCGVCVSMWNVYRICEYI